MSNDRSLVDHGLELLAPLGRVRAGRMFSGHALYIDELCVALVLRDTLYLKAGPAHRTRFEAAGCQPFRYGLKTGEQRTVASYYSAPDEAMESAEAMRPWARLALEAAVAARAATPARRSPRPRAKPPRP